MNRTRQWITLISFGLTGLFFTSPAAAQYQTPGVNSPVLVGKVIEKDCQYNIKTTRARQNLCQLIATKTVSDPTVQQEAIKSCLETMKFKAYKKAFFAEYPSKKMTLTKSYVKGVSASQTCDLQLARVFDHFHAEDDGRLVKIPGHWRAIQITCN